MPSLLLPWFETPAQGGYELLDAATLLPPRWCLALAILGQCAGCIVSLLPLALDVEKRVNQFFLGELSERLQSLRHWMILISMACFGTGVQLVFATRVAMGQDLKSMLEDIALNTDVSEALRASVKARKRTYVLGGLLACIFIQVGCFCLLEAPFNYRSGALAFVWALLILVVQYAIVNPFLENLIAICSAGVRMVIHEMLPPEGTRAIEWTEVFKAHKRMEIRMDALWELTHASLIVGPLLFGRLIIALFVIAQAFQASMALKAVLLIGAMLMLFSCLIHLWPLAEISDLCNSTKATHLEGNASIRATAMNLIGDDAMGEQQRIDHLRYLQFVNSHMTGVELGGMLITKSLIVKTSYQLLTSVPLAIALLETGLDRVKQFEPGS